LEEILGELEGSGLIDDGSLRKIREEVEVMNKIKNLLDVKRSQSKRLSQSDLNP
jgi:hypothetical protein